MSGRIEARLADYMPWVITGNLLFLPGQLPVDNRIQIRGQIAATDHDAGTPLGPVPVSALTLACNTARLCGLALFANAEAVLGNLDYVTRVVKLVGFVKGRPNFEQAPIVVNPSSALIKEALGEAEQHAPTAVTIADLPLGGVVKVEAVIQCP